jgi:hypothetical protein
LPELVRIFDDDDAPATLAFLRRHLKARARELVGGG